MSFVIPRIPLELQRPREQVLTAAADEDDQEKESLERRVERAREQFHRGRVRFDPKNQPRDTSGKFRRVLARLKYDLGERELDNIVTQIKEAEKADAVGDYEKAVDAGNEVIGLLEEVQEGDLPREDLDVLRQGAKNLGVAIANLPLPKGMDTQKVRYSDLPPATTDLIEEMIAKAEERLEPEKAAEVTDVLRNFMAGGQMMNSDDLLTELNRILALVS